MAYQHLSDAVSGSYADSKTALKPVKERFEPASQTERYRAEFENRRKKKTEGWACAHWSRKRPTFTEGGSEGPKGSLSHYLRQLEKRLIALSAKQKRPRSLDKAVSATLSNGIIPK